MIIVALCTKMQPPPKMCRHNILISHTSKCKRTLVSGTIIYVDTQNRKLPLGAHLSFAIFKEFCLAKFEEVRYFTSVSNTFLWTFASIMEVGG